MTVFENILRSAKAIPPLPVAVPTLGDHPPEHGYSRQDEQRESPAFLQGGTQWVLIPLKAARLASWLLPMAQSVALHRPLSNFKQVIEVA